MGVQGWFVVLLFIALLAAAIRAYRVSMTQRGKLPRRGATWMALGLVAVIVGGGAAAGKACARLEMHRERAAAVTSEASAKARALVRYEINYASRPRVNVRSGPGEEHPIVRTLVEGEPVRVVASIGGTWRQLGREAVDGEGLARPADEWVHATLLEHHPPVTGSVRRPEARGREPARSGPNFTKEELTSLVAVTINLNGYLCAEVVDIHPLAKADTYEVTCIEYRGGRGKKLYIFDAARSIAFPQN